MPLFSRDSTFDTFNLPFQHLNSWYQEVLRTNHVRCPDCGGNVMSCDFRSQKGQMTVYGLGGVRHVVHRESRCQDCRQVLFKLSLGLIFCFRIGLFYGYRILKGGKKIYEKDALRNKSLGEEFILLMCWLPKHWFWWISVVSSQTCFDVDFCFRLVMSTFHHAATFEGLADEFNDLHCKGVTYQHQRHIVLLAPAGAHCMTNTDQYVTQVSMYQ